MLRQALNKGLKAIVVVNKVDRPAARPDYAVNATFDLFIDLGADDDQADFPVVYAKALDGTLPNATDLTWATSSTTRRRYTMPSI